ncbi:sugar isomerase [Enterococcus avium]|uniref:SIS domain-containing protein n=1 Tax=Enterococcus devriesei TaxID=319970 RepID=UPI00159912CA|nr:SIS domain-containing protein [Enterococcus devriesei]MBU5366713.1 SIS domain-containing protein [Enterococcus devriesei]BBM18430.1 sugar isomerase [Enterococcus avium]
MYFKKENFMNDYQKVASQFNDVEKNAENLKQKEISKLFLIGSGGTYTKFVDTRPMLFEKLTIPFMITSPEELLDLYFDQIDEKTMIIAGTKTGATEELLNVLQKVRTKFNDSIIYGFIGDDETELDELGILNYRTSSVDTDIHLILFGWLILCLTEDDSNVLQKYRDELTLVGEQVAQGLIKNEEKAAALVQSSDPERMQMWITSGRLWGEACCFCNYILEEIQWIQAQAIHSSEFFHGPFELISDNFQVNVVLNSGETRKQDIRVKNFIEQHSTSANTIDMDDFKIQGLSTDLLQFVEPWMLNHYYDLLLRIYEQKTGKSAKTRRYYRVTEY